MPPNPKPLFQPNKNRLLPKSLLSIENLDKKQIEGILDTAMAIEAKSDQALPASPITGGTVVLMFVEPSTRTRLSFELAAKRWKANTLFLTQDGSSIGKGETLQDTARTIQAMRPQLIVLRHPSAGSPHFLDKLLDIPIVNAGDGFHEHPTQALLDAMTILKSRGKIQGKKVLIVGDIAHSRVARSNIHLLQKLGAKVTVCGPPTLLPPKVEKLGVDVEWDFAKALPHADIVIMLRIQFERLQPGQIPSRGEYIKNYSLNSLKLKLCKEDVLVMHPGPMNRGLEITSDVADGPKSVILDQVANGVALRMAVLHLLAGGEPIQ